MEKITDIFKRNGTLIALILIAFIFLILSIFGVLYIFEHFFSEKEEPVTTDTTTEQISFYYGSSDNEISVDVLDDVKKNTLNNDNFTDIDGLKYYVENGVKKSHIGIDVSEFQHEIDWQAVKNSGIEFAIIRAGFRGCTEGGLFEDDMFKENIEGALNNGIEVGVYFFSQAINEDEALEEAKYLENLIKDYNVTYPVVFDWERVENDDSRTKNLSKEQITNCALSFCSYIKSKGYKATTYYSEYYGYMLYDLSKLKEYNMWYVEYDNTPDFYYEFNMWQYSESGSIDGIDTDVDLNIYLDR